MGCYILINLYLLLTLIIIITANRRIDNCPRKCTCSDRVIDCSNAGINTTEIFLNIPTHFPLLITLNMTGNKFEYLEKDLFNLQGRNYLPHFEQLDLSNCAISGIHEQAFVGLYLEELILSRNNLSFTTSTTQNDVPGTQIRPTENFLLSIASTLKILDLSNAFDREKIRESPAKFVFNLSRLFNETEFKVLQYLNLSNNQLINLPSDMFCRMPNLEYIYLSSNRLYSFHIDDQCVPALMEVDLKRNFIRRIDDAFMNLIDDHHLLKKLDLSENPFTCDCDSQKFIRWIRSSTKLLDKNRYTCTRAKPRDYVDRYLISIPEEKLLCPTDASEFLHSVYILCGIAFIGLMALLICIVYTNRRFLCKPSTGTWWMPLGGGYQSLGREPEVKAEMV